MTSLANGHIATTLRAAPLAIITTAAAVLLRFPPSQSSFYPRCPIYECFHLQCPGCGATRAVAALLRGHFSEAMHSNALVTLLLPIAVIYGTLWYSRLLHGDTIRWPQPPQAAIYGAFGIAAVFAILRNLQPFQHFR
jgi:hypothetical protein